MKFPDFSISQRSLVVALGIALAAPTAMAAITDIATSPLSQAGVNPVRPNIQFILDDSGSMAREYVPDGMGSNDTRRCFKNHIANQLYYNPATTYLPPKNADGTSFASASFSGARSDGYNTFSSTTNLSTNFDAGDGVAQAAYYYRYTGTSPAVPVAATCYADTSYTKVTIGAAEQANFANWYSYYRTRMLTMKTSVGRAFVTLDDKYRIGFSAINYTGASEGTGNSHLHIRNFDTTQKANWFAKLYAAQPTGNTPLRAALSKAGRMFAGKVGSDPVQYSCQQNFALLSTDGYWNSSAGYREDGSTAIGDHDDNVARPLFQGRAVRTTTNTDTTTTTYVRAKFDCSGSRTRVRRTVTVTRRAVTTENGVTISDTTTTTSGPTTTDITSCSITPAPVPPDTTTTTTSTADNQVPAAYQNSLSDVAMYYYKTDLRTTDLANCTGAPDGASPAQNVCANNVPISANVTSITDDNASHQHMTTFTLGLGVDGELKYAENYKAGGSTDYNAIVQGTKNWPVPDPDTPRAVDDLWHAAVNGRGTYFSAKNPDNIATALTAFFKSIASKVGAGAAAATSNLEPVAGDNYAFVANYRTIKWDGDLQARTIDLDKGTIEEAAVWSARAQLNAQTSTTTDSRTIYKWKGSGPSSLEAFLPANFTAAQKTAWFNPTALSQYATLGAAQPMATSDNLINFLRGQRGFENSVANLATNKAFREREFVLGDIINGRPIYMKKPPFSYSDAGYAAFKTSTAVSSRPGTVFIAANDGMLHAFDADNGNERWAYVPSAVLPFMHKLADFAYGDPGNHRYYVDGSPVIGDIHDGSKWKTIIVGGLNAGGRMYYALDVTDPTSPKGLWEFTNTNLGLTYGNPIITKQADGTWVVIVASGINNTSPGDGVGRLFVLNADTGAIIREITTTAGSAGTPSGLSKIAGFVDNGLTDNSTLRVYGGDMLGNVWRFDVTGTTPPAGIEAILLATLKDGSGNAQPVTSRLELGEFDGRTIVYVGTGRLLGTSDLVDTSQQTLYAIQDKLLDVGVGNPRSATCGFVQQEFTTVTSNERAFTTKNVDYATKCGWFLDFNPSNASPGERVNVDMALQLGVLSVVTNVPEASACTSGGSSWVYFLDYATGGQLSLKNQNDGTEVVGGLKLGNSLSVGQVVYRLPGGKTVSTITTSDDKQITVGQPERSGGGAGGKRVYWRELFDK